MTTNWRLSELRQESEHYKHESLMPIEPETLSALLSLLDECKPIIHEYALINNRMNAQRLNDILESREPLERE